MRTMLREKEHVSLAVLGAIALSAVPGVVSAQCVATTDCASLGYKSSKDDGGCLKCPFGNGYYCPERCEASYQYTCTGANEVKPSSAACSNRYQKCDCNSGYEWNSGACKQCASKYKYTCTGSNESAGADSCGGKYSACQCATNANLLLYWVFVPVRRRVVLSDRFLITTAAVRIALSAARRR